jgi:cell division septation protein DedD
VAPAPDSDFVERVETLREQVDEEGFLADSGTRFGEPVLTDAGADTDVWAVQVASFAEADNAENFRSQLRGDGYEAFLSTVKTDDQVLSRVAVGPLLDRQEAATLQRELSARYDTQARLMAFSN